MKTKKTTDIHASKTADGNKRRIVNFLDGRIFLAIILTLFALQAMWVAISFRHAMPYDEAYHVAIVKIFSTQISPYIVDQPEKYDHLRDLEHEASFLYHYLMSIPYRVLESLGAGFAPTIISLRLINISFVAGALLIYSKLFSSIGIKRRYSSIAILLFSLIPIVSLVSAHINYDNLLFLCYALFLWFGIRVVKSSRINAIDLMALFTIGVFASLIKFTFLPLFAVAGIYFIVMLVHRNGKSIGTKLLKSYKPANKRIVYPLLALMLIFTAMFSFTYIRNIIAYGSPKPTCLKTMERQRCLKSGIIKRNIETRATREQRDVKPVASYLQQWFNTMTVGTVITAQNALPTNKQVAKPPYTTMFNLVQVGSVVAMAVILLSWYRLKNIVGIQYLALMAAAVALSVLYVNITGYYELHRAHANQPRYLLPAVPTLLTFAVVGFAYLTKNVHYVFKILLLLILLCLTIQGGGAITHITKSEDTWYWQETPVLEVNHILRPSLQKLMWE